jgi:hypothetical protein
MIRAILCVVIVAGAAPAQTAQLSSFEAFRKAAVVLRHPRCMNCHVPGDQPLTGPNGQPHPMRVKRGVDGLGTPVARCTTCHQETNGELPHSPPGSKEWKLPPPASRMAWVGLDDQKLCAAILNTKANGGMTRDKIVAHMESDPRVQWSWEPGPEREAPPMTHSEFVELIRIWIEKGASCAA